MFAAKHLHTCSQLSNHYDTLKISKNCSAKEIKESYIKLSKENHPDLNKNKNAHTEFLKIKEAYNVLSKPSARRNYDMNIHYDESGASQAQQPRYTSTDPWKDPMFYANRDRAKDSYYESQPYYGINGVGRVSNYLVAYMCVLLTAVIVGLQVFTIRHSFTFQRDELDRKSKEAEETLKKVRDNAKNNTIQMQVEILRQRSNSGK